MRKALILRVLFTIVLVIGFTSSCQKQPEVSTAPAAASPLSSEPTAASIASLEGSEPAPATQGADLNEQVITETPPTPTTVFGPALETPTAEAIWEMLAMIDPERVLTDLRRLAGEEPICTNSGCETITTRLTGSSGLQKAKEYVYEELVRLNYAVETRDWSRDGHTDQNLVARKTGIISPDEEIYFIAHLDGRNLDGIARSPAVDDDSSGVVDILELARILSHYTFGPTVVFLFSTGEEYGALGVRSYLDQLSNEELNKIKYAINVDMVSYDANGDGVMELWSGDDPSSLELAEALSEVVTSHQFSLVPTIITGCG